ncbi:MAG: Coenzyme F420 hydrogenase/dehydrogenase, beta subunit C-terminal domain [Clostridia bacterium]|nr:Coenzyme F420 hydrogenase/dehydrogenase, beta subunit C-terminal domain [Clostridia bacterium]
MQKITAAIQEAAKKLLSEGKVDLVVGFSEGTLPLRGTPCFIRKAEDVSLLTWNYGCENNLANYLRNKSEKIAVVAKGCDTRAIVALMKENQINRDNLYIIGIPCSGMIDRNKVAEVTDGRDITAAEANGDVIVLKGQDFSVEANLNDLYHDTCQTCGFGTPVIYDELIGEPVPAKESHFDDVAAFEALPALERNKIIAQDLSKCIRCYACRNVCPMCYCNECFVDCSSPQWIGKAPNTSDNIMFQAVRVLHLAGRCVDCGACDRACPMGINLRGLTRKMVKEVKAMFNFEAGIDLEAKPALADYSVDDPETFLVKE